MRKIEFSEETVQEAVKLYKSGASLVDVSSFLGCSRPKTREVLVGAGVEIIVKPRQKSQTPPETEQKVIDLYTSGEEVESIISSTGVSLKTIYNILQRTNTPVDRKPGWTSELRQQVVDLHSKGFDAQEICTQSGLPEFAVKKFTAAGRSSVFSKIDTEEKAYWLGFITADGAIVGVNPGNLRLQIGLARRDRAHLEKLNLFLGSDRPILDGEHPDPQGILRSHSTLTCQDRAVVTDLIRLGVTSRKTGREKPWNGPTYLMRHYWRGMVDGDGSVSSASSTYLAISLVGSFDVVNEFCKWVHQVSPAKLNPSKDKRSPDHWRVVVRDAVKVNPTLWSLYSGATIGLDRKMSRAREIMAQN